MVAALWSLPPAAGAADWSLCPPQPALPDVGVPAPEEPGATRARAQTVTSEGTTTLLEGDVGVRRGTRTVGADRIRVDRDRNEAEAEGDVLFRTDAYAVEGESGWMDLDTGAFRIEPGRYQHPGLHAQGRAARIRRDDRGVSRFDRATYSTCPSSTEVWHIAADRVKLDPNTRQGTARNATLWFQGVPLLYTPWFRFPLGDERMSGFLVPSFGSSDSSGFTVGVPWYWNAAPNFDATIEPRLLSDRGTQLRTEWRWLSKAGYWQLDSELLPSDDRFGGDDRTLTRLEHRGRFDGGWATDIEATAVSDDDYFEDLGTDLSIASQTHLRRRADVRWSGGAGVWRGRLETFDTLDEDIAPTSRPFERLPQITYTLTTGLDDAADGWAFEGSVDAEAVRFERDAGDTGTRLYLNPAIEARREAPGWFLRPRLGLDLAAYDLDRSATAGPKAPARALPVLSVDSGLVFERLGESYRQTLEPRAFYVFVPEESQDDIPVFDTGEFQFSFAQLFRDRRFTGPDRRGDANRLTLALTTRLLDRAAGREVFRASIGGIHHFDDREVTLPGRPPDREDNSNIAAAAAWAPTPAWRSTVDLHWDPSDSRLSEAELDVAFDGAGDRLFNANYRYLRDSREEVDLSFAWPLTRQWLAIGRTRYSLFEDRNIETLAGFEYDSCCWKLRAVAREFVRGDEEASQGIFFELVFKGLGSVGQEAGGVLEDAIRGYSR